MAVQQAKLDKAQAELAAAMELLAEKEEEVRQCQIQYEEAMKHKQVCPKVLLQIVFYKNYFRKYLMMQ